MKAESSAWLDKAEEDYSAADWLLKSEAPLTLASAFHIQQCAEKLLKALLVEKGHRFREKTRPALFAGASRRILASTLSRLSRAAIALRR
jgi:HEPN domain-containing protein